MIRITTGMKATTSLNVTRSKAAASCTTKTSQSQSPKAAGLSTVHFLHRPRFIATLGAKSRVRYILPSWISLSKDQDRCSCPRLARRYVALRPLRAGLLAETLEASLRNRFPHVVHQAL